MRPIPKDKFEEAINKVRTVRRLMQLLSCSRQTCYDCADRYGIQIRGRWQPFNRREKGFLHGGYLPYRNPNSHRRVAERALGRKLKKGECVHHIDGDKLNNANSNLLICTGGYHRWLHGEMSRRYQKEHFTRPKCPPKRVRLALTSN